MQLPNTNRQICMKYTSHTLKFRFCLYNVRMSEPLGLSRLIQCRRFIYCWQCYTMLHNVLIMIYNVRLKCTLFLAISWWVIGPVTPLTFLLVAYTWINEKFLILLRGRSLSMSCFWSDECDFLKSFVYISVSQTQS